MASRRGINPVRIPGSKPAGDAGIHCHTKQGRKDVLLATYPRQFAAAAIAALLCVVLAFAGCAPNPAARDADTQAAIADAVAATIAAQQTAATLSPVGAADAAAPTLAPPPTPISIATPTVAPPYRRS